MKEALEAARWLRVYRVQGPGLRSPIMENQM